MLATIQRFLNKPEYAFRPSQIFRRLLPTPTGEFAEIMLSWGVPIRFRPSDELGRNLWHMGVYDLCVSEALWRLLDPGEAAIDVGANIGYMSSIMAVRVGSEGRVIAFEPHPELYQELSANVELWKQKKYVASVETRNLALSDTTGTATMEIPEYFHKNRGTAALSGAGFVETGSTRLTVQTVRLDDLAQEQSQFGLMKIDVEGAELLVMEGGEDLFASGNIRDIVFENMEGYPTPVTRFFESHNYNVFRLEKSFLGINISGPEGPQTQSISHDASNWLATCDPKRALAKLRPHGWNVLRSRRLYSL